MSLPAQLPARIVFELSPRHADADVAHFAKQETTQTGGAERHLVSRFFQAPLQDRPERLVGKLVAAILGASFDEMGKPVLVAGDAHEVFQATGDARLLVRLHLGQIDEQIAGYGGPGQQILLQFAVMMRVDHSGVVIRAEVLTLAGVLVKETVSAEVETGIAARILGIGPALDDDVFLADPDLGPHVEQLEAQVGAS